MVQMGIICQFFAPFRWYKTKQIVVNTIPFPFDQILFTSGNGDEAGLGHREANPLPTFRPISKAWACLLSTLLANSLLFLAEFLPRFLKKSLRPSTSVVLSLTILAFFLLQITLCPTNNLFSLPVFC